MATRLKEEDLPALWTALANRLPHACMVWGVLKAYLEGRWPGLAFWVDRWPHFKAAIAVPIRGQTKTPYVDRLHYMYGSDVTALRALLRHPAIVEWDKILEFEGVQGEVAREVHREAKERNLSVATLEGLHLYTAEPGELPRLDIPEDAASCPFTAEDVQRVRDTWAFATEDAGGLVQACVDSFPALCLRHRNGDRIGHAITYNYGHIGMVHVEPKYRGQGYGKVILSQLGQQLVAQGWKLYSTVEDDNMAGLAMHRAMGFRDAGMGQDAWILIGASADHFHHWPTNFK